MRSALVILLAFTLVSFASGSAFADNDWDQIEREGAYASLAVSVGGMIEIDDIAGGGGDIRSGVSAGGSVIGGYRFGKWLAAEAEFEGMHHNITVESGPGEQTFNGETFAFTLGGRAYLARSENGELWASAGVGLLNDGSGADVEFTARFSTGFDIYVSESAGFFVAGSYILPSGDLEAFDYAVGRFGYFRRF